MKAIVVVPTYNERRNLSVLVPRLSKVLKREGVSGGIIIVDDGSKDGTPEEVRRLAKTHPVELVERGNKMGLGSAYVQGFGMALSRRPQAVVQMDADLSHDPEDVPRLLDALSSGCDLAIGSRKAEGGKSVEWSGHRKVVSFFANLIVRYFAGVRVKDATSGFRAYRTTALRRMLGKIESEGYDFQIETAWLAERTDMRIAEVPITFRRRKYGSSKLGIDDVLSFLATAARLRVRKLRRHSTS